MVGLTKEELLEMMRRMLLIRHFGDAVLDGVRTGEMPAGVSVCHGEEAFLVGVQFALRDGDVACGTHRSYGHCIGRGADLRPCYAELCGRKDGMCGGRSGSMHMASFRDGYLGGTGVAGGNIGIATGAALHMQRTGSDAVAVSFFGDGASTEGILHESMNMASLWKLPVIFACENNKNALSSPLKAHVANPNGHIAELADGYNMPHEIVDGQDVIACYQAARRAIGRARNGLGPTLLEGDTYSFFPYPVGKGFERAEARYGAYRGDAAETRDDWIENRDPIALFRNKLLASGILSEEGYAALREETCRAVREARSFALGSAVPTFEEDALADVYGEDGRERGCI